AQPQPADHVIKLSRPRANGRYREYAARTDILQPRVHEESFGLAAPEQNRIAVELAPIYNFPCERVGWIVLKYERQTTEPQDTLHLGNESAPLRGRHMVHDAGREDHVEALVHE